MLMEFGGLIVLFVTGVQPDQEFYMAEVCSTLFMNEPKAERRIPNSRGS